MSEYMFGVSRTKVSRQTAKKMDSIAKKHGAYLVEVDLPVRLLILEGEFDSHTRLNVKKTKYLKINKTFEALRKDLIPVYRICNVPPYKPAIGFSNLDETIFYHKIFSIVWKPI